MVATDDLSPMLRQYLEIKERHRDAILFFRMGDFYEMFFDDAKLASEALDITLTSRNKLNDEAIPMAGFPHFAAENYIARLIERGYKVAICEQIEDPKFAKGIVKREVTQVITPGVVLESGALEARANNFLFSIAKLRSRWGMAYLDISTGDFFCSEADTLAEVTTELARCEPKEMVIPQALECEVELAAILKERGCLLNILDNRIFDVEPATQSLLQHFEVSTLDGFGCSHLTIGLGAAGAVLHYLEQTRPGGTIRLERLIPYQTRDFLVIDETSKRNLELVQTLQEGRHAGSLLHLIDLTHTAMGARLLRRQLLYPLLDVVKIQERLDFVEVFYEHVRIRKALRDCLSEVADLERLMGKIAAQSATPRDLASLLRSFDQLPALVKTLAAAEVPQLEPYCHIDIGSDIAEEMRQALVDDPPVALREGEIIREGYHTELDELLVLSREGKGFIAKLEAEERKRTGINSLKVRYNKVFGYFIEVTRSNLDAVPDHYIRKQTLTGAERFITHELKEYESKVLGAEERRIELEYDLFIALRQRIAEQGVRVRRLALLLAQLDVFASLAEVASRFNYVRPQVDTRDLLEISEGRHPVVERSMGSERFVPNDIKMDGREQQVLILTGPNMAGKSTIMRQVALITLLAQVGSFVPARACKVGIVDRIFTRVGASDNLAKGQSTFMVEMTETANILNFATPRSLVILDEIGRGTSTFDGLSIAWAVAEALHDRLGCRAMFATHYHELIDLALTRARVRNYNVAVTEWGDKIVFLRKLKEGGASRSYGLQVARLAGLPRATIDRAKEILTNLERGELNDAGEPRIARRRQSGQQSSNQLSLFAPAPSPIKEALLKLDLNMLTPLEALTRLAELQELARNV